MANKAQELLDKFVDSIGDLLNDITALEVNTMIVAEITGAKFNAWEAYQEIYSINDPNYFKEKHIPKHLQERYYNLFDKLEREHFYILIGSSSAPKKLNDERVIRYRKRIEWRKKYKKRIVVGDQDFIAWINKWKQENKELWNKEYQENKELWNKEYKEWETEYKKRETEVKKRTVLSEPEYINELAKPILPDPTIIENWSEIQSFLENNQLLRSLRKIIELKAALDSSDPTQDSIDLIYAQTVMQLDGDIINRYHMKLFEREDIKDLVLKTHNEAVVSGENQWRELLDFMVDLVRSVRSRGLW